MRQVFCQQNFLRPCSVAPGFRDVRVTWPQHQRCHRASDMLQYDKRR
ncbi:hypothetical protein FH063_001470 [Azospirillum argentinense]|uniref:Uncharacterized protein n=1 Tax=Azospirillum argentinense TaxID=2970906 RepID=A0A5B0KXG9_9PROT|nr:hypothetical protein FH063_001470 [Azospirillum argentinense]